VLRSRRFMISLTPRAIAILLIVKVVLICAALVYLNIIPNPLSAVVGNGTSHNLVGCTKEARVCPDGTYVGRVGPSCEFTSCAENPLSSTTPDTQSEAPPAPVTDVPAPTVTACTMDAKQCPDGSYVGRIGPSCEFAACPSQGANNSPITVQGFVTLGPTCPVERLPPDPACAPKPFEGAIILTNTADGSAYTAPTDSQGSFSITLTRGVYSVSRPENGSPFPACHGKVEILSAGAPIPLSCDSGIR
jgi:hypothetical protein